MSGRIILLNGASSAGKSTLAAAIQNAADVPLLRMSLDFFFFGKVLPRLGENGFNWTDMRPKVLAGYDGCLSSLARAGSDLVVDHIFESADHYRATMQALAGLDVFLVGVQCPIEELERRERLRGDRQLGEARRDLESVHTFCAYDCEVDSTNPPEHNTALILKAWNSRSLASE